MSTTATAPFTGTYAADPSHSSFQAAVRHMKVGTFKTTFDDVDATLVAGDDGVSLEGRARVESISIKRPAEFRAHVVEGEDFFHASAHPEIAFASSAVDLREDGTVHLDGELEIKGIRKPVTATGVWRAPEENPFGMTGMGLELTTTIDRRDYEITWQAPMPRGGDALGWDVTITVDLELGQA